MFNNGPQGLYPHQTSYQNQQTQSAPRNQYHPITNPQNYPMIQQHYSNQPVPNYMTQVDPVSYPTQQRPQNVYPAQNYSQPTQMFQQYHQYQQYQQSPISISSHPQGDRQVVAQFREEQKAQQIYNVLTNQMRTQPQPAQIQNPMAQPQITHPGQFNTSLQTQPMMQQDSQFTHQQYYPQPPNTVSTIPYNQYTHPFHHPSFQFPGYQQQTQLQQSQPQQFFQQQQQQQFSLYQQQQQQQLQQQSQIQSQAGQQKDLYQNSEAAHPQFPQQQSRSQQQQVPYQSQQQQYQQQQIQQPSSQQQSSKQFQEQKQAQDKEVVKNSEIENEDLEIETQQEASSKGLRGYNKYKNAPKNLMKAFMNYIKSQKEKVKVVLGNEKCYKKLITLLNQKKSKILSFKRLGDLFQSSGSQSAEKIKINKCIRIFCHNFLRKEILQYLQENRKIKNQVCLIRIKREIIKGIADPTYFSSENFLKIIGE